MSVSQADFRPGVPILCLAAYSWRLLAKVDLKLKQFFCDDPYNTDPYLDYVTMQNMPRILVKRKEGKGFIKVS